MIDQFQKLDDLIVEHTQLPVRTILRNQLALTREQVEAYQAGSDEQDKTLSRQAQEIERLMIANADLEKKLLRSDADQKQVVSDSLSQQKTAADAVYEHLYEPEE